MHPPAAAGEDEPIVVKQRVSLFIGTDLETLLRANGIETRRDRYLQADSPLPPISTNSIIQK